MAANWSLGKAGEGIPGADDRVVSLARRVEVALPHRDQRPEPARVQLAGEAALLELGVAGIEAQLVRGLQVFRETGLQVRHELVAPRRQVLVARFRGRRQLPLVVGRLRRVAGPAQQRELGRLDRAGEDAVERVVVFGRDRVELVVVAASAGDGQAQQAAGDDVDPVVDDLVLIEQEPAADRQETQGRQRSVVVAVRELIGGDLLDR